MHIPPDFDVRFLEWFRKRTTASWTTYRTTTLEDYVAAGAGGVDWQRGTQWLGGLTAEQITVIEQTWSIRFPPDYRLFLEHLHAVDRPQVGAHYVDDKSMALMERPALSNWLHPEDIQLAFDRLLEGLLFSVQRNGVWMASWGNRPVTRKAREHRVEQLVAQAPRLIPIIGHRFLISKPYQTGNPVLSIHQADAVVYAPNLHDFFLTEFAYLLGLRSQSRHDSTKMNAAIQATNNVPFWGELVTGGTL